MQTPRIRDEFASISVRTRSIRVQLHQRFQPLENRYRTTHPPTPQEKGDETSSPSNRPPCPQINLELPMFTLTLQQEKRKKICEVLRGLPKLTQG